MPRGIQLISFFLFLSILACSETKDAFYKNIDEARRSGAVEKGWIPDILPESSTEIYERHLFDSNRVWLKFTFAKKDIKGLISQIEEVNPVAIDAIEFARPNVSWWPKDINKDSFMKGGHQGLKLYKYKNVITYSNNRQKVVPSFFIIDWNSTIAYYWQYAS